MKRDTRQEILIAARELFNERGFNAVSTRDIAAKLNISKGNLTYHFKKKEEIMEAILTELPGTPPPKAPTNLAELDAFFLNMQRVVTENAFYFWHHAQLSQLSSKIRSQQSQMYQRNVEKLKQAFHALQTDGSFRAEEYPGEYDRIIDTLLLSNIYWMPFCVLKKEPDESPMSFQIQAWSILKPLLTDQSKLPTDLYSVSPLTAG